MLQIYKKQDKLTTQTAYTTKGTATKVPTITTNTLGQVTAITETSISLYSTITVTLTSAGWSSSTQTVTATGVTASNTVIVSPAPANIQDYANAWIYASAQGSGTLTFTCEEVPTSAITVNVLIMN